MVIDHFSERFVIASMFNAKIINTCFDNKANVHIIAITVKMRYCNSNTRAAFIAYKEHQLFVPHNPTVDATCLELFI